MEVIKNKRSPYPTVNFRVSEKEKNAINKRAAELGLKRSEYMRYCIAKELETSK